MTLIASPIEDLPAMIIEALPEDMSFLQDCIYDSILEGNTEAAIKMVQDQILLGNRAICVQALGESLVSKMEGYRL